jgi:peroxiredoxin/uncharacterized membrane protein HdeD (DUF308 family)
MTGNIPAAATDSMAADSAVTVPGWVPVVLYAAALYNLAWGLFVILFPTLPFRFVGMEPPNYPALVQCLGMIVGVYGVGYALAARDPVTLWPLIFVGLLGKILGPIGFVYAASIGEFPWVAGLTILTNDLAWWLPFIAILVQVVRIQDHRQAGPGLKLEQVLGETRTAKGESLLDLSRQQNLLVVCVRHSGCTYCREAVHDLAQQQSELKSAGVRTVVVHMGTPAQGDELLQRYGCDGIDMVSDPSRRIYRALRLRLGSLSELFGIRVFWRALLGGTVFRFGFGRIVGNALQMPGAFVIRNGQIQRAFRHRTSADRANFAELCDLRPSRDGAV